MAEPTLPPSDESRLEDDTLPPEHPAGSAATVSAGEALSGQGLGTRATGTSGPSPPARSPPPTTPRRRLVAR